MENILLLHGMGGPNPLNYIEQGLLKTHKVLKPIMPGFQEADGAIQYNDDLYVNYVENYRKENNIESFVVIGYSMGGRTALNYSFTYPKRVKKLVLIDAIGISFMIPILRVHFGKPFLKMLLPLILKFSIVQDLLGKPDFVNIKSEEFVLGKVWMDEIMHSKVIRKNFAEILTSVGTPILGLEEKMSNLNMPVQLLWADKDKTAKIATAYEVTKYLKNYDLKVLKNFRHMAPLENPDFYINNILEFTKENI